MPQLPELKNNEEIREIDVSEVNREVINDLLEVIDPNKAIFCGGIAIADHLKLGEMAEPHELAKNDLDIIVRESRDVLIEAINDKFWVAHNHDYRLKQEPYHHDHLPCDRFYVVLIHKKTGVKIDVFDYDPFNPQLIERVKAGEHEILIRTAEDQAVTKLLEIIRAKGTSLWEAKNGPIIGLKPIIELEALLSVCNPVMVQHLWQKHLTRIGHGYPMDYYEAFGELIAFIFQNPPLIARTAPKPQAEPQIVAGEERKEKDYVCPECIEMKGFPLYRPQKEDTKEK